jgi:23S rRNA (uracil1939-C5)-methyltransferase
MTARGVIKEHVVIDGIDADGFPIANTPEGTIVVPKAVPNDLVSLKVKRVGHKHQKLFNGIIHELIAPSEIRKTADCVHFEWCGGCDWLNMAYQDEIILKSNWLTNLFQHAVKVQPNLLAKRNKVHFTTSNRRWFAPYEIANPNAIKRPAAGYAVAGKHDHILEINECKVVDSLTLTLLQSVRDYCIQNKIPFYDMHSGKGFLRGVTLRTDDEGMHAILVISAWHDQWCNDLVQLLNATQRLHSLSIQCLGANKKLRAMAPTMALFGNNVLNYTINGVAYKVPIDGFFQTNIQMAGTMFKHIAGLIKNTPDLTFDLYTGCGAIALQIAHLTKKIIGVETHEAAIKAATQNAQLNNIINTEFIASDMFAFLNNWSADVDLAIVDPPRAGLYFPVLQKLQLLKPKQIIYVSCNPVTLKRDLSILQNLYDINSMAAFDMFPHTRHVETVVSLLIK